MTLHGISQILILGLLPVGDDTVDYLTQVRPVLQERCFACHGALKQEAGLRVDTARAAIAGGDTGAGIVPGNFAESLLIQRVTSSDISQRMPPEGEPLKPEQVALLQTWIQQGARTPADEVPEEDPRDHWAFRVPVKAPLPVLKDNAGGRNPIDAFIGQGLENRGLRPQPATDRRTWLRRVSLDLTGLPPTREQQDAFIADQTDQAYEKVVDRLLASPQYGERWGRHWMDIWRYSDWWGLGAEVRNSQKHIWHWRDWIVESLNEDKAYDQMLREMLAADELYPNDLQKLRATGFLARQYFKFNRTSWLDETIEHTSKAMLGLTLNCGKCHDHKYDPFSQEEYYQLRAFFEPYQVRTDVVPGELDLEKDGIPRAFDCNLDAPTWVHRRGDDRNPDTSRVISPAVPAFLKQKDVLIQPVALPVESVQPGLRDFVVETAVRVAEKQRDQAAQELERAQKRLEEALTAAAGKPSETPSEDKVAKVIIRDDFSEDRPNLWERGPGQWSFQNGHLVQQQAGAVRASLRLKQQPPENFEATLRYIPRGGEMWKSVGIRFDIGHRDDDVLVYLSSFAGGPKSQIAFVSEGRQEYPADGAESREVRLDEPHTLTVRVRGTLINVLVDGKHSLAWRLPIARHPGALELITFDARAEFLSFELLTLPESTQLTEAANLKPGSQQLTAEEAQLHVSIAEKRLAAAAAQPELIRARVQAERVRLMSPETPAARELAAAAVKLERSVAVLRAEEGVFVAELAVRQSTVEKKAEAEAKLATARTALETSLVASNSTEGTYSPLTGGLKTLENNLESEESRRKPFPATSTGRRSALAAWLTDPGHPLPARVAVNHIWARHFGTGLVSTVFDFGRKGARPTHPELLDWLSVEFVEHGWSMKHIHRLIVLSDTYGRTSSQMDADEQTRRADPDNLYLWRRNPVRMEAQAVRDSLLWLANQLDLKLGGPSIPVSEDSSRRRSLYFVHSHNEHEKFLSMFDDASVLECYRRAESIVPQQALTLENSPLANEMAARIAERISQRPMVVSDSDFVKEAFLTVLCTEPTVEEVTVCVESLSELAAAAATAGHDSPAKSARISLIRALVNHNDFVTVR